MDLNLVAQRILRRHWAVILLLVLLGVSVPVALHRMQEPSYEASARFTIGSWDTRDAQESSGLADTALALATSPEAVGRALGQAGIARDPVAVIEVVQVAPVGTSGVLELTATDPDPTAAATITNALAAEVVRARDEAILGDTRAAIAGIDGQIAALSQEITRIEDTADATVARLRSVEALALRHAEAVEQRTRLENQRQQLVTILSTTEAPRIIDGSATSGLPVPTALVTRLAIGGLLGLVLGVALAATLESWRPTLTGPGIAHHLGAPLLDRLPRPPKHDTELQDPWLTNYLTLAADAAGVRSVKLVPVGPEVDVSGLAGQLDGHDDGGLRVTSFYLEGDASRDAARSSRPGTGIVAVVPDVVKGTSVFERLERHVELARQPVIGVLTYRGRWRRGITRSAPRHLALTADEAAADRVPADPAP
ncbi:uncharacterized protein involved in exopolysaccharide biosynthesis [Geodermatophilus bullaregiensis]|uniref:hypothetical protein n=1 Tax=Geodermatophilus bullaregiensis TaxID=1564160 RepID=UPI00195CCDC9|nr:hypothetical protein [Geodermatophilus bullaregiensis]MBM7808961.1 uncharacterized protein involved in exopolysaccharide biosynthesis [Geodermatophilus bullaregiensis]